MQLNAPEVTEHFFEQIISYAKCALRCRFSQHSLPDLIIVRIYFFLSQKVDALLYGAIFYAFCLASNHWSSLTSRLGFQWEQFLCKRMTLHFRSVIDAKIGWFKTKACEANSSCAINKIYCLCQLCVWGCVGMLFSFSKSVNVLEKLI